MKARVFGCAVALVFLAACKKDQKIPGLAPPPPNLDRAVATPSAVPSAVAARGEEWQRALAAPEDPIELERLAVAEGATGLLAGLEEGGPSGVVALAALPYADDAELACGRLAEILRQSDEKSAPLVLESLFGIVDKPRRQVELVEPLGYHAVFDALVATANRKDLPNPIRARAVSVARLVADRAPYDVRLLPTEFDR